ncbi:MAG: BadF/BadG/BcrA/BcrD ATPase family protein [Roseiarcus sp.]
MQAGPRLFLGVDDGASRCRARIRDAAGALVAEVEGPGGNMYVDFEGAIATARAQIEAVCAKAGLAAADRARLALGLGLAGLSSADDAKRVEARFEGMAGVRAANDAVTACLGAHGGGDGALVISGTGSAAIARVRGRDIVIGGRGFLLGDDGSAARVGADAVRAALRAHDGLGPASPLTQEVMRRFRDDPLVAIQWAVSAKPAGYGAFAPLAFERAGAGDEIALAIVRAAARAVDALIRAVQALGAERVALVGGLSRALRPYLEAPLQAALRRPSFDAADGAILLAGGVLPASESGEA